ncbi:MAG: hypothetical protein V3W37_08915 [Candidatus Binatia bacterium]
MDNLIERLEAITDDNLQDSLYATMDQAQFHAFLVTLQQLHKDAIAEIKRLEGDVRHIIKRGGQWYFVDELECDVMGPYLTEIEAKAGMARYAREDLNGESTPEPRWYDDLDAKEMKGE